MERQDLHDRLNKDLALHGWAPAISATAGQPAHPGWRVFLFNGLGYAGLMWSEPDDRENAEKRQGRDLDDAAMRISNLTAIHEALIGSGYTADLDVEFNDTPQIRITRVPA